MGERQLIGIDITGPSVKEYNWHRVFFLREESSKMEFDVLDISSKLGEVVYAGFARSPVSISFEVTKTFY